MKPSQPPRNAAHPRPDILLVMPDQMRGDCLSAAGHPAARTPTLDGLAEGGALFSRAFSPVPSCIPARYAMLTGLSPGASGVVGYAAKPFATKPFPGLLAEAGYSTTLVGRYMHQCPECGDCGYQRNALGSTHVNNDDYDRFLMESGPETGGIRALVQKLGISFNHWQAEPWPLADELHPTEWIVAQSRRAIEETDDATPLFLTASFYAPHPPLFPPRRYFEAYVNAELPSPARGDWVDWDALRPEGDEKGCRVLLEGETLRRAQAGYYGLIEHLDAQIAPLIREFQARSERAGRPWVVLVTTDHGEMLGDHGYFRKCEPYQGSAHIPFLVCGSPELGFKQGLRISQPVSLVDVMPTLLGLTGVPVPEHADGADLAPVLRGEEQRVREWLHYEHAPCYSQGQAFHALTDGTWKYIWRPANGAEQLFNLEDDPREERDLAKSPGHGSTLEAWRDRLARRLAGRPEGFVQDGNLAPGRPYPPLTDGSLARTG